MLTTRGNVAGPQRLVALGADQVETRKVITFTQRVLAVLAVVDREELLRDDLVTVLEVKVSA